MLTDLKGKIAAFIVLFALIAVIPVTVGASASEETGPSYEWMKTFSPEDGSISSVWQLSDGSFVAGGQDENGRVLLGLSEGGEITWEKEIPGGDENGTVKFVSESPLGGLYLFTDGENLIKTTSAGDMEWTYHLPQGVVRSIEVAENGNVLLAGDFLQSFLTMVSPNGTELWNKTLDSPQGGGQYRLTSVQSTPDGGFIIAGYINPILYTENYRGFVMKTDADGNQEWASQYSGDNSKTIISITPSDDGNYAAALVEIKDSEVTLTDDNEAYVPYVTIIKDNGTVLSEKAVTGADVIYHIKNAGDGGYYLLASTYDAVTNSTDYLLIKTDAKGNKEWTKNFGQTRISSVQVTNDGGIILAGTDQNTNEGILIRMSAESQKSKESFGFEALPAVFALICALFCLRRK